MLAAILAPPGGGADAEGQVVEVLGVIDVDMCCLVLFASNVTQCKHHQ